MNQTDNVSYIADATQFPLFFSKPLQATINKLNQSLSNTQIIVFPDATLKTNLLPTGVVFRSRIEDTMLLPFVLRDPGCGYTLFKFEFTEIPSTALQQDLGQFLDELISQNKLTPKNKDHVYISEALNLTIEEKELLQTNFLTLTNTIEIRQLSNINQHQVLTNFNINPANYIGFVHSGSYVFPDILLRRFIDRIIDNAYKNNLFSSEMIDQGIVGVPYYSELGQEYLVWIKYAMEYATASRKAIFAAIQEKIEQYFPVKLTFLIDHCHAGIFDGFENNRAMIYMTRGSQPMTSGLNLIAGQRETIAALVTPGVNAAIYHHLLAHGTGYHILENYNYTAEFSLQEIEYFTELAQQAYYNTTPQFNECIPLTHNILSSLKYFEQIGLANLIAWLTPFINIHSNFLKDNQNLITGEDNVILERSS